MKTDTQTIGVEQPARAAEPTDALAALWTAFADAPDAHAFCRAWLDLQCSTIDGVKSGLLLLESGEGAFAPVAVWPAVLHDVTYLRGTAEEALLGGRGVVRHTRDIPDAPASLRPAVYVAYPIEVGHRVCGAVVLDLAERPPAELQQLLRALHWGVGWVASLLWERRAEQSAQRLDRAAMAADLLAAFNEHERLEAAAMALVNEAALGLGADRAAVALARGAKIRMLAMSHGAHFKARSQVVEQIVAAMEEAYDQNASVAIPAPAGGPGRIGLAHAQLAAATGSKYILSVVLPDRGRAVAVLTLERRGGQPFGADEMLLAEAVAALVGPAIALKARERRWIAGRGADHVARAAKVLAGPRRPFAKLATATSVLLLAALALVPADFRVSADAVLEGGVQRVASAPFAGFIAGTAARAGDVVRPGAVLATLDDKDLQLDRVRWASERDRLDARHRQALATHNRAEMSLLGAQLRQAEAQLALVNYKLARTRITAPIAGIVVTGDLSQMIGAPVEEGKVLFEVAPLSSYRVVLKVDERDIGHVAPGQPGRFAPRGLAGGTVPLRVTRLTSVAAPDDGNNVFRVEAALDERGRAGLRPGMEGVAKVTVGERSLLWIWTRGLRDWLRLFVWEWAP